MRRNFWNYYLPNILFNVFEVLTIIGLGLVFGLDLWQVLSIFMAFILNKVIWGNSLHYKDWYLCLIWSCLLFISYYLLAKINTTIAIFATIEFVFFSKISNIKDLKSVLFWGGNNLNLEVFDWVKYNQDNIKLKDYENKLKELDKKKYYIFKYRFREFKIYKQIADLMDIDAQRVSDEIKIMSHFIEFSIRLDD